MSAGCEAGGAFTGQVVKSGFVPPIHHHAYNTHFLFYNTAESAPTSILGTVNATLRGNMAFHTAAASATKLSVNHQAKKAFRYENNTVVNLVHQ